MPILPNTPNLNLRQWDSTESWEYLAVNDNFGLIDAAVGATNAAVTATNTVVTGKGDKAAIVPFTTSGTSFDMSGDMTSIPRSDGTKLIVASIRWTKKIASVTLSATSFTNLSSFIVVPYRPILTKYFLGNVIISTGNIQEPCLLSVESNGNMNIRMVGGASRTMAIGDYFSYDTTWVAAA